MTAIADRVMPASEVDSALVLRQLTCDRFGEWDRFVDSHPSGSFFHRTAWMRVIEKTFGFEPRYHFLERQGRIVAVAPLFSISNRVTGHCLISVPFAVYGGICAENQHSEDLLLSHLKELARSERVQYMDLRFRTDGVRPEFHLNPLYFTFSRKLQNSENELLQSLPRDTRYMIRKAEKNKLVLKHGFEQLDVFYDLFAISMRRFGTPVFPKRLFRNMIEEFQAAADLSVVYSGKQAVSGVLSFLHQDTILPYYAGAASNANSLAANNFMYWELMKFALHNGSSRFDFGRSKKGTGAYAFKTQWNVAAEPLSYQTYLVERKTAPNFSPVNPKFELATRVWRKLPLPLTKLAGPRIVCWFP